jgi:hypothetical protein
MYSLWPVAPFCAIVMAVAWQSPLPAVAADEVGGAFEKHRPRVTGSFDPLGAFELLVGWASEVRPEALPLTAR